MIGAHINSRDFERSVILLRAVLFQRYCADSRCVDLDFFAEDKQGDSRQRPWHAYRSFSSRTMWTLGSARTLTAISLTARSSRVRRLIVLVVGSLAAYAFARMDFVGNQAIFFLIFVGMTFPVSRATRSAAHPHVQAEPGRHTLVVDLCLCSRLPALRHPDDAFVLQTVSQRTGGRGPHRRSLQPAVFYSRTVAALYAGACLRWAYLPLWAPGTSFSSL